MTSTTWAVLGATGFVGSATVARLQADGQTVVPVSAPRLGSGARTVHHLLQQARRVDDHVGTSEGLGEVVDLSLIHI